MFSHKSKFFSDLKSSVNRRKFEKIALDKLKKDFLEDTFKLLETINLWFQDSLVASRVDGFLLDIDGEEHTTSILTLCCETRSIRIEPHSFVNDDYSTGILQVTVDNPDNFKEPVVFYLHWKTKTFPKVDWMIVQADKKNKVFSEDAFFELILPFTL
ncbi:hypothetical protein R2E40_11285 [Aeromonas sp. CD]|uniref:hypothetical protein n=1 Tax=Aeromonas sp. CD TaxID=3080830 RepID=UPI0029675A78|nr:hypothetical protein [Aeromonas sp. CD]WOX54660.1 hypothetical protein R2E40_11285 [Aeromonas sp. CD]